MQTVITWTPNPPAEQVTEYSVYMDGALVGKTATNQLQADLAPGAHAIEVAANNVWGEGPKSDPVSTPPVCSKPVGINLTININISL